MKDKDCKENQIFNTKTNRCINKDSKKAIEYLFNIGDKTIHKLYDLFQNIFQKLHPKNSSSLL